MATSTTLQTENLEIWLSTHGAYLHRDIRIVKDKYAGVHVRATAPIRTGMTIVSVPHCLALSPLNALVDDDFPVFKQQRRRFKIEAVGFFYLMAQYIHRETSFWKPYLETLPQPDEEFTQPLFFEDPDDVAWLEGTDVWFTNLARKEVYEKYYHDGIAVLKEAGVDVEPYTWHLFKWAVTIFTSRSFASRSLHPEGGQCWQAYKTSSFGSREAVVLNMSNSPPENLEFAVLFPGLDALNHSNNAKVDWLFDPGRFSITLAGSETIEAGQELFNNYGPKPNAELLLGYGFCIPNNPHDNVSLTLKAPPTALQATLVDVRREYFTRDGLWSPEKATFDLKAPPLELRQPDRLFRHLPEPLLELLLHILRHERGLEFFHFPFPLGCLTNPGREGRYALHIARIIVQSLAPKLAKIQSVFLPSMPLNEKQRYANIYLISQVHILGSWTDALRTYTRSLIYQPPEPLPTIRLPTQAPNPGPCLTTLESFVTLLQTTIPIAISTFLAGIEANANTQDLADLRLAGWEEDIWVLLLCYLMLVSEEKKMPGWLRQALRVEYIIDLESTSQHDASEVPLVVNTITQAALEQATGLLDIVRTARAACADDSAWGDERWTAEFIAGTGGKMLQFESFVVGVLDEETEEEEARLHVLLDFGVGE